MTGPAMLGLTARDIAEPIYASGELGWTFKQVKWIDDGPPVYEDESDYWILVEQDGAPKGIVHVDSFLGWSTNEEPLARRMQSIDAAQLIASTTTLFEVLRLFASRSHQRYYLLDGARVTHWLEEWHLSSPPVRLAILEPCLELDMALEALMMLAPANHLDDNTRTKLRAHAANWGYTRAAHQADDLRALARCAGFRDKWDLIRRHPTIVAEAIDFLDPESTSKAMFDAATLRDGLVHGHPVLPINPFSQQYEPIPDERFRKAAGDLVSLITTMRHMTASIQRFVRARTPRHLGGDFDLLGPA